MPEQACEYGAICTPDDPCGLHEAQRTGREQGCARCEASGDYWVPHPVDLWLCWYHMALYADQASAREVT